MTSFNVVDYIPSNNSWLLDQVLHKQWNFDGFYCNRLWFDWRNDSSWSGRLASSAVMALKAGTDMDMCAEAATKTLENRLMKGKITIADIDKACRRILEAKYKLGLFQNPYKYYDKSRRSRDIYTLKTEKRLRNTHSGIVCVVEKWK